MGPSLPSPCRSANALHPEGEIISSFRVRRREARDGQDAAPASLSLEPVAGRVAARPALAAGGGEGHCYRYGAQQRRGRVWLLERRAFVTIAAVGAAMGWALLATLRTVAGRDEICALPWTVSWTEPPGQTVQSGLSAVRLRGIRAGSASGASGRTSHKLSVVNSNTTRPTAVSSK